MDLCDICKYKNEKITDIHCGNYEIDYVQFEIDYITQIAKDFNCSRSLAKSMYYSMIVTYRIKKGV